MTINDPNYYRKYYALNKERLRAGRRELMTCECGLEISKGAYYAHKKCKKHLIRMIDVELIKENELFRIKNGSSCIGSCASTNS